MPLLAFVLPVEVVAPVSVLVSITVGAIVVAQDWRHVQMRIAGWLVLSSLFGIPLGLLLLSRLRAARQGELGVVVAGAAAFALMNRGSDALKNDRLSWVFDLTAGILGGAYGMNGPPLVVYGTLRRWSPGTFARPCKDIFSPPACLG